jgi:hypothetical protein
MSDQLFKKRKAKKEADLKRRKAYIEKYKRILIICEGSKTEPLYLAKLAAYFHINTIDIKIVGEECGSDPKTLYDYGEKYLREVDADFD